MTRMRWNIEDVDLPDDEDRCRFKLGLWLGGSARLILSGLSDDLGLLDALPETPAGGCGAARFFIDFGGVDDRGLVDREVVSGAWRVTSKVQKW